MILSYNSGGIYNENIHQTVIFDLMRQLEKSDSLIRKIQNSFKEKNLLGIIAESANSMDKNFKVDINQLLQTSRDMVEELTHVSLFLYNNLTSSEGHENCDVKQELKKVLSDLKKEQDKNKKHEEKIDKLNNKIMDAISEKNKFKKELQKLKEGCDGQVEES